MRELRGSPFIRMMLLLDKQGGRLGRNGGNAGRGAGIAQFRRHEAGLQTLSRRHNGKGILCTNVVQCCGQYW